MSTNHKPYHDFIYLFVDKIVFILILYLDRINNGSGQRTHRFESAFSEETFDKIVRLKCPLKVPS